MKTTKHRIAEVLSIGDTVYVITDDKTIQAAKVVAVCDEGIQTDLGWLSYRTHRNCWWLTRSIAEQTVMRCSHEA